MCRVNCQKEFGCWNHPEIEVIEGDEGKVGKLSRIRGLG